MSLDRLVPRDSTVYGEVARLYRIAQSLRPTGVDRWNGELYATSAETWGSLHHKTGALRLSEHRVLAHLTGSGSRINPRQQAQGLASVLHEATHAGMQTDAPTEPNAVRSDHSLGLIEGFAEVRTFADFELFADRAGYGGLTIDTPQYPGAFAATRDLMAHVTGPAHTRAALIDEASRGPGVMHFDQFAKAVVANRLSGIVPNRPADQRAVRAALIASMLHAHWPTLTKTSAGTGESIAREIRATLDAKVDEIRRHYRFGGRGPFDGDQANREAGRSPGRSTQERLEVGGAAADVAGGLRFLGAQAPAGGAVTRRPLLGQGERRAGTASVERPGRATGPGRPAR
jgi:hypothetical protein